MRKMIIICLVLTLLTSSACSTEVADTQVLKPNNQETGQSKERREVNGNLAEANNRKEQQVMQADKTLIKNTKGLVVLSDRYGEDDFVRFYNEDGSLWYEFTYYYAVKGSNRFEKNENFLPFAFHPDYFTLALKCVGEDNNRYEVIVNEETGLKKFVRKDDPTLKFETWEEHIPKAFAVNFNREENPLREAPEGKVKNVDLPKEATFHPVEIKGEWLKVRWDGSKKTRKDAEAGWVKWKENNKILIELFYTS